MTRPNKSVYEYDCDSCHGRFTVEMTFRERAPFDRDEQGNLRPTGYPELQPACPQCHSHDVVRVEIHEAN